MCGLVAMFGETGAVARDVLLRAAASLHHRGPDGRGHWINPAKSVGLGHTRLSILDLEGGTQPLCNEDETVHAVVNGEFYDFERIRTELERKGHRFKTRSDSEILLHLYEEMGTACVEQLRGEFAFALYDAKMDILLVGRDRFGIKPLVYARINGVLVVASEAKALFAAGLQARWDTESFFHAALMNSPMEDRTFFAGVQQLPPGHLLVASRAHERVVRYWDIDYPLDGVCVSRSEAEDIEELSATFDEAVRLRLRADVPVACYLSGGIDSASVLGFAARHARQPVRTFTLCFEGDAYNEDRLAHEMSRKAGAEYNPIPVTQKNFAEDFIQALWHAERPLNNANSVAKFRLSRAVRDAGIKVVLTGEGSDEIFAGYPHYRRDLFLQLAATDPVQAAKQMKDLNGSNAVSRGILMPDGEALSLDPVRRVLGGFAPTWIEAFACTGKKIASVLSPTACAQAESQRAAATFIGSIEATRRLRGRHVVHQSMYLWSKSTLPNYILTVLGDRMEMAHSVEGRVPFLDHRVVELATRLPIDRLIRGTVEKYVLREAAKPVITESIYRRQKHPFLAPPASAQPNGELNELMQDTLTGAAVRDVPFFDPGRVAALVAALPRVAPEDRAAIDAPLMSVLSVVVMNREFGMTSAV